MATKGKEATPSGKEAGSTNPRGIPYAPFVDKVEDYVTSREEVEPTLRQFQEMISKYQFMELNLQRRVAGLEDKMPDIQKTLETVRFLQTRTEESDPIETTFELNDTLYAKASVPPTDEVYLWLGTMEVAVARVYNWDVVQKRKDKADEEGKGRSKEGSKGQSKD
ncbi:hypothetical protein TruAng_006233 [Truncatella angustata]|nr:hypothetical protein TruAng_006233 [Truncatella angustata]